MTLGRPVEPEVFHQPQDHIVVRATIQQAQVGLGHRHLNNPVDHLLRQREHPIRRQIPGRLQAEEIAPIQDRIMNGDITA